MAPMASSLGLSPAEPQPGIYQDGEMFGLNAFLRDGDTIYRTYFTSWRGVEVIGPVWSLLDRSLLGRQETWEDSPEGYPKRPLMSGGAGTTSTRGRPDDRALGPPEPGVLGW